jgi:hypothetical protein
MIKETVITTRKLIVCIFLLSLFSCDLFAQQTTVKADSIADKLSLYGFKNQRPLLFIHFDKNIYTNNENVWFTGYFLNSVNRPAHKTLSVFLIKDDERVVVLEGKFIISDGLVFGNLLIPDSVASGNYNFLAYTNHQLNGESDVLFKQPITIKNTDQPNYTASLNPLDTSATASRQKLMLLVNFMEAAKKPKLMKAKYYVGNSEHPILKGEIVIENGLFKFDIPSNLLSYGNNRLHVQLSYLKEKKDISIDLPAPVKPAIVRFYPEGGNLVGGVSNTIGWEVKSFGGNVMAANAVLYQGNNVIDKISTNSYGLGRFMLTPKLGANYYVKLTGVNKIDTLYKLPSVIGDVPSLNIGKAVVDNMLIVDLRGRDQQKLNLIIHNYKNLFLDTSITISGKNKRIRIQLDSLPKGLCQITLTDNLRRPFAERLFFAHHDRKVNLQISTNTNNYNTRQKVTLKLKLAPGQVSDSGLVSIACVQENRLEIKKKSDIESYAYLKFNMGDLPVKESYLGTAAPDKQFLEDILLLRGWRRYTWIDVMNTTEADTAFTRSNLMFSGTLTKYNKPINKAQRVINYYKYFRPIYTDSTGHFVLTDRDMIIMPARKLYFIVDKDPKFDFEVHITDPYIAANKKIVDQLQITDLNVPQQQNTQMMQLPGFENSIQLKEVKIRAKINYTIFGANSCGDYVCRYNIFNCRNHVNEPDNFAPIVGKIYINSSGPYKGCDGTLDGRIYKKGIYAAQEFYPSDYSKISPSQPDYVSTLYWKFLAKVTSNKEAEFSFYTSDIGGRFKIVVQGRTAKDMIYGEQSFNVVKPQ